MPDLWLPRDRYLRPRVIAEKLTGGEREFQSLVREDAIDRIAELLVTDGVSVHEAVDWVVVEESERFTPTQ